MLIGNKTRNITNKISIILITLLCSLSCSSKPELNTAWWYDITIKPIQTTINSTSVESFDPNWTHATVLEDKLFVGKIKKNQLRMFRESNFKFHYSMDLNKDGDVEDIYVGVYEKNNKKQGRFLAIMKNNTLIQRFVTYDAPGFSALLEYNNMLRWYKCMECNDYDTITWSGTRYFLE